MGYRRKVREEILDKALEIYKNDSTKLNNHSLAKELNISNAKIHYHFGSGLKHAVEKHAVEKGDSQVIVQLYASGSEFVNHLSEEEISAHFKSI